LRDCADVSLIAIGFPPSLFDLWGQYSLTGDGKTTH